MFKIGMIHGRFQPFNLGHFQYLKAALHCSKELIVGITNPDPTLTGKDDSDSHRHHPDANPFPYYLRMKMIQNSVFMDKEIRCHIRHITVIPFPINKPNLWAYYIPQNGIVQIMNTLDEWDHRKKKMFIERGFQVHVLGHGRYRLDDGTELSSTIIRKAINSKTSWHDKVPDGTKEVLDNWLSNRIEQIFHNLPENRA